MDELVKADIFFVIASVGFIILAWLCALILYKVYRILDDVEDISRGIKKEGKAVVRGIAKVRSAVENPLVRGAGALGEAGENLIDTVTESLESFTTLPKKKRSRKDE